MLVFGGADAVGLSTAGVIGMVAGVVDIDGEVAMKGVAEEVAGGDEEVTCSLVASDVVEDLTGAGAATGASVNSVMLDQGYNLSPTLQPPLLQENHPPLTNSTTVPLTVFPFAVKLTKLSFLQYFFHFLIWNIFEIDALADAQDVIAIAQVTGKSKNAVANFINFTEENIKE